MQHLGAMLILMALPVLAQDAPLPHPVEAAPVAQAAPAAPSTTMAAQVAQQHAVGAIIVPVLEGDAKVVLSQGTYDSGAVHASGVSYVPIVGLFAGSVKQNLQVVGEYSETKAPTNLKRITLVGYSPKSMGMYGTVLLCKAKVDEGNRVIRTSDGQVEKGYFKAVNEIVKLTQDPDGAWAFEAKGHLEAGHYVITFLKMPIYYWDFDVK